MVSSTPRPHFTPGKDPVPILQEAGWAPGPVWTGGKSRRHRDSIPDRSARSSVAIPIELPDQHRLTVQILNDPRPCIEKLDMISKPTNACNCMKVYHTYRVTATCSGHSCGHLQEGTLQSIDTSKYFSSSKTSVIFPCIYPL